MKVRALIFQVVEVDVDSDEWKSAVGYTYLNRQMVGAEFFKGNFTAIDTAVVDVDTDADVLTRRIQAEYGLSIQ